MLDWKYFEQLRIDCELELKKSGYRSKNRNPKSKRKQRSDKQDSWNTGIHTKDASKLGYSNYTEWLEMKNLTDEDGSIFSDND